jgi:multiple sugar transport system permease protein
MRNAPWGGYRWLIPVLALIAVIELIPFLIMTWYSVLGLSYTDPTLKGQYVGLDNYRQALGDPELGHSLLVTAKVMLALPLEFALGLGLALALSQHLTLKKYVLPIMVIPMILPPVVVGLAGALNLNADFGLIGIALRQLGWVSTTPLGDYRLALPAIILVDVWQWTPFLSLIFLAALLSFPKEPYEAARVDGASSWQIFRRVTLPLMRPIFVVAFLLRFTDLFKIFDTIFIMTGGGPGAATEVLNLLAYKINFRFWNIGYGAAVVMLLYIVSFLVSFIFVKVTAPVRAT